MELNEDDMYVKTKNKIDDSDVKIPYAEMDSVDFTKSCCCCYTVNDQTPGYGCDSEKVAAITADLQERKDKRGNIAHLRQLQAMQATALGLDEMARMILEQERVQFPPAQAEMNNIFPHKQPRALTHEMKPHIEPWKDFETKTYNITNYPANICGFLICPCQGCTGDELELTPHEMIQRSENLCGRTSSRTPYGNLGAVETETACCCCSTLPDIGTPGCGCSSAFVEEIAAELQERKVKRGSIAQIMQQENITIETLCLEAKLDVLMHKRGIQYPPAPEVMARIFLPPQADSQPAPQLIGNASSQE